MDTSTKNKKKRPLCEFKSLEELVTSTPQKFAKLHGVITELSDMTEADKYFEGRLADNKASVRIVGFNRQQQKRLSASLQSKEPVELDNCTIKKQLYGDEMEVVIGGSSLALQV